MQIRLFSAVTTEHKLVLNKYLVERSTMTEHDWRLALEAFDLLKESVVLLNEEEQRFDQIYQELIDERFADEFLNRILAMQQVEVEGNQLRTTIVRQISYILLQQNLYRPNFPESRCLLAYCYFWWDSFARGCIFEVRLFKDLESSGISFTAHDLRHPTARHSPYDLSIMGYEGGIKTSTYFLYASRTRPLSNDFYITRLYDTDQRERIIVVMLKEAFWNLLDGETIPSTIHQAPQHLPHAVHVDLDEGRHVVIEYENWKTRVRAKQQAVSMEEGER